jgi:hypothetical protein
MSVVRHLVDTVSHIRKFLREAAGSGEVTMNAIISIVVCFVSLNEFSQTKMSDIIQFSDVSYQLSDVNTTVYPLAVVSSLDLITDSVCIDGDRLCKFGYPSEFYAGTSGILAYSFAIFNQFEFSVPHLLAAALWFTTPISLFLLANQTWDVFEQWMWWGLYMVIFIWEVVGLSLLLIINYAPMYNKILVFVYFLYSTLLIYAVRETWMLRNAPNIYNDKGLDRGRMDKNSAVPAFMQNLVIVGVSKKVYTLAENGDDGDFETTDLVQKDIPVGIPADEGNRSALAPEVVTHTFTRTVLLLCEFFFIAPVIYVSAFVLVQERVIPMDVQVRHWQTSLMFGIVVLIEKSRKTRLSYVTDAVLSMAGVLSVLAVSWFMIPEVVRVLTGVPNEIVPSSPVGVVLYLTFLVCYLVAVINLCVSMVFVIFIGKDQTKLSAFQNADASQNDHTKTSSGFERVVNTMYYLNALSLCAVKIVLLVCFSMKWLDNRVW